MVRATRFVAPGILGAFVVSGMAFSAHAEGPTTFDRMLNPEPENWLMVHGNYASWRYSELDEINTGNVGNLKLAFSFPLGDHPRGRAQSVAVVDSGFLYMTNVLSELFKFDVRSGSAKPLWVFDPEVDYDDPSFHNRLMNRGVVLTGDTAILASQHGNVFAIDRSSGEPVWNRQVTDPQTEALTGQPYAIKDMVYVANSNGDWGTRGWAEAMDSRTGEQVWRFYFVPAPGEPGNETWGGDSWKSGGAAAWTAPSYDPELNFLYWGTSNASPAYDAEFRPGDNLYTASTVVLNADTGELEWYFQYQANEALELDEINQRALVDVVIGGVTRKVMAHQSTRNGHFYVLDRVTGDFMSATRQYEGPKLWTAGIDPKTGHPVEYDPNLAIQTYGGHQPNRSDWSEPFCQSRTSWGGQAYHPGLGRVYSEVSPSCTNARKTIPPAWHAGVGLADYGYVIGGVVDGIFYGHTVAAEYQGGSRAAPAELTSQLPAGAVTATDVATGEVVARGADRLYNNPDGGILATAGGLVFTGHQDGTVIAYDARTMATLWSINVGTTFGAPPIAYAVSGKQYIAINGGRAGSGDLAAHRAAPMLWVFSL